MDTDQLPQPTLSLASLLPKMPVKKAKGMGERQQLICRVAYELGIEKHYVSGLYFQSKLLTDKEILELMYTALNFKKNPAALFRTLLKAQTQKIIDTLT